MRLSTISTLILLVIANLSIAQQEKTRENVTNNTYKTWKSLDEHNYDVSSDGNFLFYIHKCESSIDTLVVRAINGNYQVKIPGGSDPKFTSKGDHLCYKIIGDTLAILDLINKKADYYGNTISYELLENDETQSILIKTTCETRLVKMLTKEKLSFYDVQEYILNDQKDLVMIQSPKGIFRISLKDYNVRKVFDGINVSNCTFDRSGRKMLFVTNEAKDLNKRSNSLYLYDDVLQRTKCLVDSGKLPQGYILGNLKPIFNSDGNVAIAFLESIGDSNNGKSLNKNIKILHYQKITYLDDIPKSLLVSISTKSDNGPLIRLAEGHVSLVGSPSADLIFVKKHFIIDFEIYSNPELKPEYNLISIDNGRLFATFSELPMLDILNHQLYWSPFKKFVYWWNTKDNNCYSYEVSTKIVRKVTDKIKVPNDMRSQSNDSSAYRITPSVLEWLEDDTGLLIKDKYDLWQVDPQNATKPICLTGGLGRYKKIIFEPALEFVNNSTLYRNNTEFVLRQMDEYSKNNGFSTIILGKPNSVRLGLMQRYLFSWAMPGQPSRIKKALKRNIYLVTRQSAEESPNLFLTKDFNTYEQVSFINPENEFDWMTSELVNYPIGDGKMGEGIFYKPSSFDGKKKYPLIIHYYQKISHELRRFLKPSLSLGSLNIAWYLSNGYVVFQPDIINDKPGQITGSTVVSIDSAISFFEKQIWLDKKRIGLQGHSFGGYETNIIITNSQNKFAAAQTSAGISDAVSGVFGIPFLRSGFSMYEKGQFFLNDLIWDNPSTYFVNSPVLSANKINTPLFIMHNPDDVVVPFHQGQSLFYALRRLHKPAWLISYLNEGHLLLDPDNSEDFDTRQQQFFNHYLKGAPMPDWMIEGTSSLKLSSHSVLENKN